MIPQRLRRLQYAVAVAAAAYLLPGPAAAQEASRSGSFTLTGVNGLTVQCQTTAAPGLDYRSTVSVTVSDGLATIHRLIADHTHGVYFGYDMVVLRVAESPDIRLHFSTLTALDSLHTDLTGLSPAALRAPLADNTIGDRVALDLPLTAIEGVPPVTDHLRFAHVQP